MDIYKIYSNKRYSGELYNLNDLTHYIASTPANTNLTVTDLFDTLILTTYGNLLNNVPDKRLLKKIHPNLVALQTGEKKIRKVELI